jgi:nucleoside-diphosphate-sugar epimerase
MPRPGSESVVLVTGFPSPYARKMIEHSLASDPTAFLYITVDPGFAAEAHALLAGMISSHRDRVALLEGSPTAIDFGLSGAEFRQLTREVDLIHHMVHAPGAGEGADKDKNKTKTKHLIEAMNVGSAAEIVEIARAASSLQCLVFHSTAGVSGERHGVIGEGDLDEGQSFRNPAFEARMRAEKLVRKAMADVPIAVVRPTTLVGGRLTGPARRVLSDPPRPPPSLQPADGEPKTQADPVMSLAAIASVSHSPAAQSVPAGGIAGAPDSMGGPPFVLPPTEPERLEGIYLLILLLIATPPDLAIPLPGATGDVPLNIVPIDFAVRAAYAIGKHPNAPGQTFHIADPRPPPARRVIELVTKAGRKRASRGYVPSDLAKTLLRTPGIERVLRSPRAFLEELLLPVRYDTRNTDAALAGTGLQCPPFEAYVDELVAAVEEHVRGRRERRAARREADVYDPLS